MTTKTTSTAASKTAKPAKTNKVQVAADVEARLAVLKKLRIIIRAAAQHSAWVDKQCGVNGAQLWIMQELLEDGELRVGELAARLAVHQTTASNLLDDLEKRGLVTKARSTKDQRVVTVQLTRQGKAILTKGPKPGRGLLAEALRHLDHASLDNLDHGLQGLLDSIEMLDEEFGNLPLPFML